MRSSTTPPSDRPALTERRWARRAKIAAGQFGEQLGAIVARIEAITDDLAKLDRGKDAATLSPEGRHILGRSGADGLRDRLKTLEGERV